MSYSNAADEAAEAAEREARFMRLTVQLPRTPVPVAHESLASTVEYVLGGADTGDAELRARETASGELPASERAEWHRLVLAGDPLHELTLQERRFVWQRRGHLLRACAAGLPPSIAVQVAVRAAPWHEPDGASGVHKLLRALPRLSGREALVLLDGRIVDEVVRAYAVACLASLDEHEYRTLLLPLVAMLKHERLHWSPLAHWLLARALAQRRTCGQALFWALRAELHRAVHGERLALLLEAYW